MRLPKSIFMGAAALILAASSALAQETLVIRGGTAHPLSGAPFVGSVVVQDGKIAAAGQNVAAPAGARVIDASGLQIYPGLFDAGSTLGLVEVGAIEVMNDTRELGNFTPHLQARTAVHPAGEHIPVARANGITHTLALPAGGTGFAGQGSAFNLSGWTIEEMEVEPAAAMVMVWPSLQARGGFGGMQPAASPRNAREDYDRDIRQIASWLSAAREYDRVQRAGAKLPRDLRLEALARVTRGELPVIARVDREQEIRDLVAFAEREGIRLILAGARAGYRVASLLAEKEIPVIIGPTQILPSGPDAPDDEPYANPGKLHAAGVKSAFASFGSAYSRTLPYEAAMGIPYGLPREAALRAITTNPAEILGLGDRLGTIEPGKIANLIVTDGDPLEIRTQIRHLIIAGAEVSTMNKHEHLYETYRARPQTER
jgi:imidazolonepropionase-like amidohydrolase